MNIHEYQAKEILRQFGVPVPKGVVIFNPSEISEKIKKLNSTNIVVKAQIHAGGRGKAGGIKLTKNLNDLLKEAKSMFGKTLVTHQTGPKGTEIKTLYLEEACKISKEFYLSCLIDRSSAKITFISSSEGGTDIEAVARKKPEKIITVKLNFSDSVSETNVKKILKPFTLNPKIINQAHDIIQSIYKILIEKDANLIEINPLILTNENNLLCLDAKINFDDNALYLSLIHI